MVRDIHNMHKQIAGTSALRIPCQRAAQFKPAEQPTPTFCKQLTEICTLQQAVKDSEETPLISVGVRDYDHRRQFATDVSCPPFHWTGTTTSAVDSHQLKAQK